MQALSRAILASTLVITSSAALAAPALAECVDNPNRWPAFERVAPTARQVLVGRVSAVKAEDPELDYSTIFTLEVEDVLKGDAPTTMAFDGLRSGLRLRGEQSCRVNEVFGVRRGDRIALALGGGLPGIKGRVNSAAWIEGSRQATTLNRGLRRMGLDEIRQAVGLDPLPSLEAVLVGRAMTITEDSLTLESVPAVAWNSAWPEPIEGVWDVASFAQALVSSPDGLAAAPAARLSIAGYRDPDTEEPEEIVLEVTGLEVHDGDVQVDFIPIRGRLPFLGKLRPTTHGPTALTIDLAADAADFLPG